MYLQKTLFGSSFSPKKKQGLPPAKILFFACKTAAPFIITFFANIQHMIFPVFLRKITPLFFQMEIILPFCVNLSATAIAIYFISYPNFFQNGFVCFHAASPFVLTKFSFLLHFNMAIDIFLYETIVIHGKISLSVCAASLWRFHMTKPPERSQNT